MYKFGQQTLGAKRAEEIPKERFGKLIAGEYFQLVAPSSQERGKIYVKHIWGRIALGAAVNEMGIVIRPSSSANGNAISPSHLTLVTIVNVPTLAVSTA